MTIFTRNALGFFIQLFPCMLMIFLPFPQEAYRFRKGWIFAGIALSAAALAGLFPLAMRGAAGGNTAPASNLFMLAAILITLAAYIWLVRDAVMKKTLVFFIALFYAAAQYWLVNALGFSFPNLLPLSLERESGDAYSPNGLALFAMTTAVLLPLTLWLVIRPLKEYIQEVETEEMRREFFILTASMAVFILLMMYIDQTEYPYRQYLRLLPLFFTLLLNQMLIFWLVFRESVRRKRDAEYRRAMEIRQIQYEKIVADMENTRRMRHDLRHHYNALSKMLEEGKLDEMKDYLSKVSSAAAKRMNETYCENMTVNGLLQYYAGLALDAGIRCDVHAECGELAIEPADLTVVFGNALENAIHACGKCAENPWISVRIGMIQGTLALEISNSCREMQFNRHFQAEDGFSPAEAFSSDREGGGYGLRSIAHTARKYDGSAKFCFSQETETFTARIRLNARPDQ